MDSYAKVERDRIEYIQSNQKQIRIESYQGLMDHIRGQVMVKTEKNNNKYFDQ